MLCVLMRIMISYIEVIAHMLRPGGVWVNQGPLLFHWAEDATSGEDHDDRFDQSIEVMH